MDISEITNYLYVGAGPEVRDAEPLLGLGVRLIISMRGEKRPPAALAQPQLQVLWLRTYDVFFMPIPVSKLMEGVQAALPVIQNGGRVLVHCQRGRHRSVAMGAAILIAMGASAEEAMALLQARRKIADPHAPHIQRQIKKFEQVWRAQP